MAWTAPVCVATDQSTSQKVTTLVETFYASTPSPASATNRDAELRAFDWSWPPSRHHAAGCASCASTATTRSQQKTRRPPGRGPGENDAAWTTMRSRPTVLKTRTGEDAARAARPATASATRARRDSLAAKTRRMTLAAGGVGMKKVLLLEMHN